ncbi:MAG: ABC transporter ATP-binding protein [Patescibacteria group bacterium]
MPLLKLLKPYTIWVIFIAILGILTNGLAIYVPKLAAQAIDQFRIVQGVIGVGDAQGTLIFIVEVVIGSLLFSIVQIIATTYLTEKVAFSLRHQLINKISEQTYGYISTSTPGRILTVMTSDVEAVKSILSRSLITMIGALVTFLGAAIFLLVINTRLAIYTLSVIPFLIVAFGIVFGSLGALFNKAQETVERISAIIGETIVGSSLIRVLDSIFMEKEKFRVINEDSKNIGTQIVKSFALLIPIVTILANTITLIILWFGGNQVINGTLSLGNFSSFFLYSSMFIWPIFVIGFVGPELSRGFVSLKRINEVLDAPVEVGQGQYDGAIKGDIEFRNVSLKYTDAEGGERIILKNLSFTLLANSRNAIVGPTAAGKTQLFYLIAGLVNPSEGAIFIDGRNVNEYKTESLLSQIGLVFQDSIVFNTSFRDNIALSEKTSEEAISKALKTAELHDLIEKLPKGLDGLVSERGTSLSGGQKQRLMLARALAIEPKILLLDDFTARVDQATEASILKNVAEQYPEVTLVSITQKVEPIKKYDKIIVLMEGELVAEGNHDELLSNSFEYKQIYESQKSIETIGTP